MRNLNIVLVSAIWLMNTLQAKAGTDEPCGSSLRITQRINRGETQQQKAIETLIAINVVGTDSRADYKAGQSISLLPGFTAERGSTFTAQVGTCSCDEAQLAAAIEAGQLSLMAYPNPFVETTRIRYRLTEASPVNLSLVNEQGQVVEVLVNGEIQESGSHEYTYRNSSAANSIYLFSLRTNQGVVTKRLIKQH